MKRFFSALGIVVLIFLLVLFFLPFYLNTESGKNTLIKVLHKSAHVNVDIETMNLSWTSSQTFSGITITQDDGSPLAEIKKIQCSKSLFSLLISPWDIGVVDIENPFITISHEPGNYPALAAASSHSSSSNSTSSAPFIMKGKVTIENGSILMLMKDQPSVLIDALNLTVAASKEDLFDIQISGVAKREELTGTLHGNLGVKRDPSSASGYSIEAKVNITELPTQAVDQLLTLQSPHLRGLLTSALGDAISCELHSITQHNKTQFSLDITSPEAHGSFTGVSENALIVLDSPSTFECILKPQFIALAQEKLGIKTPYQLQDAGKLSLVLKEAKIPLNQESLEASSFIGVLRLQGMSASNQDAEKIELNRFDLMIQKMPQTQECLAELFSLLKWTTRDGQLNLSGKAEVSTSDLFKQDLTLATSWSAAFFKQTPDTTEAISFPAKLKELLGPTLQIDAAGGLLSTGGFQNVNLRLLAPNLKFNCVADYKNGILKLKKDTRLSFLFNPKILPEFALNSDLGVELNFADFSLDTNKPGLLGMVASGSIVTSSIDTAVTSIEGLEGQFNFKGPDKSFTTTASGFLLKPESEEKSAVNCSLNARQILLDNGEINREACVADFQVLVQQLSPQILMNLCEKGGYKINFKELLGGPLDLEAKGSLSKLQAPTYEGNLIAKSPLLSLQIAGSIDEHQLLVFKGEKNGLQYTLTPSSFNQLYSLFNKDEKKSPAIKLLDKTALNISLKSCQIPLTFEDFSQFNFQLLATVDQLSFNNTLSSETVECDALTITATSTAVTERVDFNLNTGMRHLTSQGKKAPIDGTLSIQATMSDGFINKNRFAFDQAAVNINAKADNLPTSYFLLIPSIQAENEKTLFALLGDTFSGTFDVQSKQGEGPVDLTLKSENLRLTLKGQFVPHGLVLRSAVESQLSITPQISEQILQDINPLLISAASAGAPVTFTIDQEGFFLPLPLEWDKVTMPKATLLLGKIMVANEGPLSLLIGFLKTPSFQHGQKVEIWFTPTYFTMKSGVLQCLRCDALIGGKIHTATWGSINVPNEYIDMTLGISSKTLTSSFSLMQLDPNYMLQIPMKGKVGQVDIGWGKAAAFVSASAMQGSMNPAGQVIGGVLGAIGGVMSLQDPPVPPPTTNPFPWDKP